MIRPFRIFNVQYSPRIARLYNMGDDPSLFFEYLYPVSEGKPKMEDVQFTILVRKRTGPGQPGQPPVEVLRLTHSITRDRLPASGIAFVHRQIPRDRLEPGDYELVLRADDSQSGSTDEQRVPFTFRGTQPLVRPITKELPTHPPQFGESYLLERLRQYRALNRIPEATREAEAALARTGLESATILNVLAELYSQGGDRRKALHALRRSLARDPSQADVRARIETLAARPGP